MQAQTREDIEANIEECKETIYQLRYWLRWFILGIRVFWASSATSAFIFIVLLPLGIPIIQPILSTLGTISLVLSFVAGLGVFVAFMVDTTASGQPLGNYRKALREAKRELAKHIRRLTYYDEYTFKHLPPQEQYIAQVPTLITSYRKRADNYRRWFILTQIIVILLSATITSLSGGWLDKYITIPWTVPVFSAVISVMTSFTLFFKPREKGTNLQQTADDMDLEHQACTLGIGAYKGFSKADALILFAERTEALRKEQQQRQQQLEQSSQADQKAALEPAP